jgi:hypothetical protein
MGASPIATAQAGPADDAVAARGERAADQRVPAVAVLIEQRVPAALRVEVHNAARRFRVVQNRARLC